MDRHEGGRGEKEIKETGDYREVLGGERENGRRGGREKGKGKGFLVNESFLVCVLSERRNKKGK